MTYSLDFRQQVLKLKENQGLTFEQISEHFHLGITTLFRWKRNLEPCLSRHKRAAKQEDIYLPMWFLMSLTTSGKEPSTLWRLNVA